MQRFHSIYLFQVEMQKKCLGGKFLKHFTNWTTLCLSLSTLFFSHQFSSCRVDSTLFSVGINFAIHLQMMWPTQVSCKGAIIFQQSINALFTQQWLLNITTYLKWILAWTQRLRWRCLHPFHEDFIYNLSIEYGINIKVEKYRYFDQHICSVFFMQSKCCFIQISRQICVTQSTICQFHYC